MEDRLTIRIMICDRPYTVKVPVEDEELFRQSAKKIEKTIERYATIDTNYRDKQDLLAMALLEHTIETEKTKKNMENHQIDEQIIQRLYSIDNLLKEQEDTLSKQV